MRRLSLHKELPAQCKFDWNQRLCLVFTDFRKDIELMTESQPKVAYELKSTPAVPIKSLICLQRSCLIQIISPILNMLTTEGCHVELELMI